MTARLILAAGLGALVALYLAGRLGDAAVMPSYRAAWLFMLALPVGALTLVLLADLLGRRETPILATVRGLLALMPLAAVLAIPVLFGRLSLAPVPSRAGFAAAWAGPPLVFVRGIVLLLAWVCLAWVYRRPAPPGRPRLAGLGLGLHMVMGTLAASDWIAAVDPVLNASGFGLLVIVAQAGTASAMACLLAPRGSLAEPEIVPALVILLAAWVFLHFTQYLVVWSANLPDEAMWYVRREGGLGHASEIIATVTVLVVGAGLLGWPGPRVIGASAGTVLMLHLAESFWLVVPADRARFSLTLFDGLAVLGLGGVLTGVLLVRLGRRTVQEGCDHAGA